MKKLLIGFFIFGSFSAFSQSKTAFEKGYDAGLKACGNNDEAWICKVKSRYGANSEPYIGRGSSRAKALLNVASNYNSSDQYFIQLHIDDDSFSCDKY